MYKLPANVDLSFFKGNILLQICIGANEIILRFENQISITVQTDVVHKSQSGDVTAIYKSMPESAAMLVGFLHSAVTEATAIDPSTISLRFANGEYLEIYDTSTQYESYQIVHGHETIIV